MVSEPLSPGNIEPASGARHTRISDHPGYRTAAAAVCTASPFASAVIWPEQQPPVFNDAFAALAGPRAAEDATPPWPRGLAFAASWADAVAICDRVLETGSPLAFEDSELRTARAGIEAVGYFTFTFAPLGSGAVLVTAADTTAETLARRRSVVLRELGSAASSATDSSEALSAQVDALSRYGGEVPFAIAMVLGADRRRSRIAAHFGIESGLPTGEMLLGEDVPWFSRQPGGVSRQPMALAEIPGLDSVALPGLRAYVCPAVNVVQQIPYGVLVLGINPDRPWDDEHRTFLDAVADRITINVDESVARSSRARALQLIDSLPALVSLTRGPQHIYEMVNQTYADAMGVDRSIVGKPFLEAHTDAQLQRLAPVRDRVYSGEVIERKEYPIGIDPELNKPAAYFDILYQPVFDPNGDVAGVLSFAINVTEQVHARQRVQALADELAAATRFKDELLALVSHELRTPLTISRGNLELLKSRGAEITSAESRDAVEEALQGTRRLERLIDNMLALSRAELSGPYEVEPVLIQRLLPATVREMAQELRIDLDRIALSIDPGVPPVLANPVFLDQIVENLVTNALKYGDPAVPVQITARRTSGTVLIAVENAGSRINRDELRLIFDPFFRTSGVAAQAGGLGLGLAVCRRLAEAQGAAIEAEAPPAGGLRVSVSLRIAPDESE